MASPKQENKPKFIQSPDLVTFYANGARIVSSEYEARVYFSDQVPPSPAGPSGPSIATERVCVIMAHKFAERFAWHFGLPYSNEVADDLDDAPNIVSTRS